MTLATDRMVRVVADSRICPAALGPGGRAVAHIAFRPEGATDDAMWAAWVEGADGRSGRRVKSVDALSTDPRYPWGNRNANIYGDHCTYFGNDEIGFQRRKDRVTAVRAFMVDFDFHRPSDMPLPEIARVVESTEFQSEVPCHAIFMTGHGYQIHIGLPADISGDDDERAQHILEYESRIQSALQHFRDRWHLVPDDRCKDITRLHRNYPSFNTKDLRNIEDEDHRIAVREVLARPVDASAVKAFMDHICTKHPSAVRLVSRRSAHRQPPPAGPEDAMASFLEPPCIRKLWEQGSAEGLRNASVYALACRALASAIPEEEAQRLALEFNSRCSPPEEESAVADHVSRCYADERQAGCPYMREACRACDYQQMPEQEARKACPYMSKMAKSLKHPYFIGDDGNVMRIELRPTKDGEPEQVHVPVTERGHAIVTGVIREKDRKLYKGKIVDANYEQPFELDASIWANRSKFAEAMKSLAGDRLIFAARNAEHLSLSSELLCDDKEQLCSASFGWSRDFTKFHGVGCVITKDGIVPPSGLVFRATHQTAKRLRLTPPESEEALLGTLRHIRDDLLQFSNPEVMQFVIGTVFVTPFVSLLRERAGTTNAVPSIILVGLTGKGKTAVLVLANCFFGIFRDGDLVSFLATPRVITDLGWWFRDAIYAVDDLKWASLSPATQTQVVQVLQACIDGHGRDRLTNQGGGEWTPLAGKEIRGTLCISAEDLPSGEASVFARCMIVPFNTSVTDIERYGRCLAESKKYSTVMAAFLHWYLRQGDDPHRVLLDEFDARRKKFERGVPRDRVNVIRVCSQLSLNLAGYSMFIHFATSKGIFTCSDGEHLIAEHEARLAALRDQRLAHIAGETAAEKFLLMVSSLLSSGRARLDDGTEGKSSAPVIGFVEADEQLGKDVLYLDPQISFAMAQKCYDDLKERIPFGTHSLGQQLGARGYLVRRDTDRQTYSKVRNGRKQRYYAIDLQKLDWGDVAQTSSVSSPWESRPAGAGEEPPSEPPAPDTPIIDDGFLSLGFEAQGGHGHAET